MAHLVRERLSAAAWEAFGLEMAELVRVARFLGAESKSSARISPLTAELKAPNSSA